MKIDTEFLLSQSNNRIDKISWRLLHLKMTRKLSTALRRAYKKETDFNVFLRSHKKD